MTDLIHIYFLNQTSSKIKQPISIKYHILSNSTNYSNTIQLIYITIQTLSILNHNTFNNLLTLKSIYNIQNQTFQSIYYFTL